MADRTELSSCITSSFLSNGSSPSSSLPTSATAGDAGGTSVDVMSLNKLSQNLKTLLIDSEFDCSDAEIVVDDGPPVGVHRCILAARSQFFRDLFAQSGAVAAAASKDRKPQYRIADLVQTGTVGREAFMAFLSYLYTGSLEPLPLDASTCADSNCPHVACMPAINVVVEMTYASSRFQIQELVSLLQRRLLDFVKDAVVDDVIPILQLAFSAELPSLLTSCVDTVAESDLDSVFLEKVLPCEVYESIKRIRGKSHLPGELGLLAPVELSSDKCIWKIHRALDSDDIELVDLLLSESPVTLDDAKALHYAVSHCDSKVVCGLLARQSANVNLRDDRGHTPLHLAAMRREPAIIGALISSDASVLEETPDGRNAVSICRRRTRLKDYHTKLENFQESNKGRMCIDMLEEEEKRVLRRDAVVFKDPLSSLMPSDNLDSCLFYLQNRVALAKLFFPAEAEVAMQIANASKGEELAGPSSGDPKEVAPSETTGMRNKRLREKVDALKKTVEFGCRYFPQCSQFLDKLLREEQPCDDRKRRRMRFCKLKEDFHKAFSKDKDTQPGISSSSSSSFPATTSRK